MSPFRACPRLRRLFPSVLLALSACLLVPAAVHARVRHHDPDALWRIVHGLCVPAARRQGPLPAPCTQVVLPRAGQAGYVIIRDRRGVAQHLLIPIARVRGIESPQLLRPQAPDYMAEAWRARHWVEHSLGHPLPRGDIGLAINSIHARSQDQLHIHIDCMKAAVRAALDRMLPRIGAQWALLPQPLAGHPYRAMRLYGRQLHRNPLKLLARSLRRGQQMGQQTLVVVGQRFAGGRPGFLVLAGHSNAATGNWGGGEELLDHQCGRGPVPARHSAATPRT